MKRLLDNKVIGNGFIRPTEQIMKWKLMAKSSNPVIRAYGEYKLWLYKSGVVKY